MALWQVFIVLSCRPTSVIIPLMVRALLSSRAGTISPYEAKVPRGPLPFSFLFYETFSDYFEDFITLNNRMNDG
jgi:hypothetical protein